MRYAMDRAQRAKQFAPFDALKGFAEALRAQEKIIVPKVELSEDKKEELDILLKELKKEDIVTIIYYDFEKYVMVTGVITKIDPLNRQITIVDTKISFSDIRDIIMEG